MIHFKQVLIYQILHYAMPHWKLAEDDKKPESKILLTLWFLWIGSWLFLNFVCCIFFFSTHCLCMPKSFWLCSWNATYDSLLGSNKPFPQPIPLGVSVCHINPIRFIADQFFSLILPFFPLTGRSNLEIDRKWLIFLWIYGSKKGCMIEHHLWNESYFEG